MHANSRSPGPILWTIVTCIFWLSIGCTRVAQTGGYSGRVLIEAEAFDDYGGWTLDSQFVDQMGSPYLMAHGLGRRVSNAKTSIALTRAGHYRVWVRSKDWVPGRHPGRFKVRINGIELDTVFGADDRDWHWHDAGLVALGRGKARIELTDLTGFNGRCDAIYLTLDDDRPAAGHTGEARSWRRRMLAVPDDPPQAGPFDVVVVGGGVPGCAAALTAARLGCRVALVQNRPVLGGNASTEVGIPPRGWSSAITNELVERDEAGELSAERVLRANPNVSLFLNWHVFDATRRGDRVDSVIARHGKTNKELRFTAPVFIDTSGRAAIGRLVGAELLNGREGRSEFNEFLAPAKRDPMHHGHTIMFHTKMTESPVPFPEVSWAVELAGDFADLGGQTIAPGKENIEGPRIGPGDKFSHWTHFWEYGQWLDTYEDFEKIRDHLLRALIGTFSNVKTHGGDEFANLQLAWVSPVLATGSWSRLRGDYIVTEHDVRGVTTFPDAVAKNGGAICLHYPGGEYDFRLGDWKFFVLDPFFVPFRALYSTNIDNLMMAGKHISATHVAGGATKFMLNGAQCGIAVGAAAYLCNKHDTSPRGIYNHYLPELQDITGGRGPDAEKLKGPGRGRL